MMNEFVQQDTKQFSKHLARLRWRIFFSIFTIGACALAVQVVLRALTDNEDIFWQSPTFVGALWFAGLALIQGLRREVTPVLEQLGMIGVLSLVTLQFSRFVAAVYQGQRSPEALSEVVPWLGVAYAATFIVFPIIRALLISGLLLSFVTGFWAWHVFNLKELGRVHFGLEAFIDTAMASIVLILLQLFLKRVTESGARAEARSALLEELAHTDGLTGLNNRRFLEQRLASEYTRAIRYDHELSVAMCDLDFFKAINDQLSHALGDTVLQTIAKIMQDNVREVDIVARYGGEEFVLVFVETPLSQAKLVCEKVRQAIASHHWQQLHPDLRVTASFGLSDDLSLGGHEKMLAAADRKMYEAKHAGRNQVRA